MQKAIGKRFTREYLNQGRIESGALVTEAEMNEEIASLLKIGLIGQ
jgi:hypothetical protein